MPMTDRIAATHKGLLPMAVLAAAVLAGCALNTPKTPEAAVTERAKARWEALLADDVDAAYKLYSPGFRSGVSRDDLARKLSGQRVRWQEAEFQGIDCEEDICHPEFRVTYEYRMPVRGVGVVTNSRPITEDWIRQDGRWYYVPPDG